MESLKQYCPNGNPVMVEDSNPQFVQDFIRSALTGKGVTNWGGGQIRGDYVYLCRGLSRAPISYFFCKIEEVPADLIPQLIRME